MIKLKINKNSIKWSRIKKKDWSWNTNNKEGQTIIFERKEKKIYKKKLTDDNSDHHHQ
jgi:hypothetical protein